LFGCVAQVEPGMPLLLLLFACTYCCMHALPFDQQVTYRPDLGEVQEYFLGSGGLINQCRPMDACMFLLTGRNTCMCCVLLAACVATGDLQA
jgi:hypothetical protein